MRHVRYFTRSYSRKKVYGENLSLETIFYQFSMCGIGKIYIINVFHFTLEALFIHHENISIIVFVYIYSTLNFKYENSNPFSILKIYNI
jgi:hypothetical protein